MHGTHEHPAGGEEGRKTRQVAVRGEAHVARHGKRAILEGDTDHRERVEREQPVVGPDNSSWSFLREQLNGGQGVVRAHVEALEQALHRFVGQAEVGHVQALLLQHVAPDGPHLFCHGLTPADGSQGGLVVCDFGGLLWHAAFRLGCEEGSGFGPEGRGSRSVKGVRMDHAQSLKKRRRGSHSPVPRLRT